MVLKRTIFSRRISDWWIFYLGLCVETKEPSYSFVYRVYAVHAVYQFFRSAAKICFAIYVMALTMKKCWISNFFASPNNKSEKYICRYRCVVTKHVQITSCQACRSNFVPTMSKSSLLVPYELFETVLICMHCLVLSVRLFYLVFERSFLTCSVGCSDILLTKKYILFLLAPFTKLIYVIKESKSA